MVTALNISIHVPREGHDGGASAPCSPRRSFLSTCPVRGTTRQRRLADAVIAISIHVPREGHDPLASSQYKFTIHFYPRAP